MSIWVSEDVAGIDGVGEVVSYIEGWSNHYPHHFPRHESLGEHQASVGTGWIAPFCVPGQRELADSGVDTDTTVGPWLRLDITMRRVSLWGDPPRVDPRDVYAACLDEDAVRALRDNLTRWLELEKVYPKSEAS